MLIESVGQEFGRCLAEWFWPWVLHVVAIRCYLEPKQWLLGQLFLHGVSGPLHMGSPCGPVASGWSACYTRAQHSKDVCPKRMRPPIT